MRSLARLVLVLGCIMALSVSCGPSEPDRDPIRLQANAVGGGQVLYEDLGDRDTMLWFWAPW